MYNNIPADHRIPDSSRLPLSAYSMAKRQYDRKERKNDRRTTHKKKRFIENDSHRLYNRSHDFFLRKQQRKTHKQKTQKWGRTSAHVNPKDGGVNMSGLDSIQSESSRLNIRNLQAHCWVAIDSGDCAGMAGIAVCCNQNKGTVYIRVGGAFLEVKHSHIRALYQSSTYTRNMETFVALYAATDCLECDLEVLRIISDFVDCPLHYENDTNISSKLQLTTAQQFYYGYTEDYPQSSTKMINRVGHNDELVITSSVTRLKESWRKIGLKNGCNDLVPYRDLQIMCSLLVRLKTIDEDLGVAEVYADNSFDMYADELEYLVPLDCLYLPYHRTF